MEFRKTNYIAINVRDYEKSVAFYRDVLGWELIKYTPTESKFRKDDTYFFMEQQNEEAYAVFFEYEVDNMDEAKSKLLSEGCKERQVFAENSVMFTDPYGMNFHVFEKGTSLPDM